MNTLIKTASTAALLALCTAAAFADTGRPTDYVAPVQVDPVDRHADDAFARYQRVVDGPARAAAQHAQVGTRDAMDSYASYLMVVDGVNRDVAIERSRAQQESIAVVEQRRLARAGR